MKIFISGEGGHMCSASIKHETHYLYEVGDSIQDAVGRLIAIHHKELGIDIEIAKFNTSAYDRSVMDKDGNVRPMNWVGI